MGEIDSELRALIEASPNFGYLARYERLLTVNGARAETLLFTDANAALFKCRKFVETYLAEMVRSAGITNAGNTPYQQTRALEGQGFIDRDVAASLHEIRQTGNEAVHGELDDRKTALTCIHACWQLGVHLHRTLSGDRRVIAFVPPVPPPHIDPATVDALRDDLNGYRQRLVEAETTLDQKATRLAAETEARERAELTLRQAAEERDRYADLAAQMERRLQEFEQEFAAKRPERVSPRARDALVARAQRREPMTEVEARREIDRMLRDAGWVVQDHAALNPHAGRGVAVREFPLSGGRADYVLYVDQRLVGVVEAKREGTALTGVEWQTGRYANRIPHDYRLALWRRDAPLPFRYETTGTETRFTNGLDPEPRSRPVFSFHRPETIAGWMHEADDDPEAPTLRARLRRLPPLDGTDLRPAQVEAVRGVEASLAQDRPRALVQMATGAGKTYAAVTQSYRMIRHARARRVLFLVDRNNLGEQAEGEFRNYVTPDDGRKLSELYNVQRLSGSDVTGSSSVVIATIQRLYLLLRGEQLPEGDDPQVDDYVPAEPVEVGYNSRVPPETFDLVVVDECHRSIYGRWRAVIDYFDAPVVGLTATPTKQTLGFFDQNLVSEYTYEEAVADRVNVPFDVYRIRTEITEQGATIDAETVVPVRDRLTRRERYEELDDDFSYTGQQIGRSVIAKDQIRLVLRTFRDRLYTEIFPGRSVVPKTLIFAKDDNHADDIVQLVREVFGKGNDFAAKITYRSYQQGNDPKQLLQAFRNDASLRIAVTVDMIATGTDVRPLECVFFLRDVRSPVYFEQMKGRGARTIDDTEYQAVTPDADGRPKERFVLVDAVGVTEAELVDAKPLDRDPKRTYSLKELLGKAANQSITVDETSTLGIRLRALDSDLTPPERADLADAAGGPTLADLVKRLIKGVDADDLETIHRTSGEDGVAAHIRDTVRPLAENPDLRNLIVELRRAKDIVIDDVTADRLLEAAGVPPADRAAATVRSFRQYLADHRDEINLQQLLHGSEPHRPTYQELNHLVDQIRRLPYVVSVQRLWHAYADSGEPIRNGGHKPNVMDLWSILRFELGLDTEIRPYAATIGQRFDTWVTRQEAAGATFTSEQRWFLERMAGMIATSGQLAADDLDQVPFTQRGGLDGYAAAFGSRAEGVLAELNQELVV